MSIDEKHCLEGYRFGIEVEFVGAHRKEVRRRLGELSDNDGWKVSIEQGLACPNHHSGRYSDYAGGELISPILEGGSGLDSALNVISEIAKIPDIQVNRSCGLHVHFSWPNWNPMELVSIASRYYLFERVIDEWMPITRQNDHSDHARCLHELWMNMNAYFCTSNSIGNKSKKMSFSALNRMDYKHSGYGGKIDFSHLGRGRKSSIEFRHHHGTLNVDDIENWIKFLAMFINESRKISTGMKNSLLFNIYVIDWHYFQSAIGEFFEDFGYSNMEFDNEENHWSAVNDETGETFCFSNDDMIALRDACFDGRKRRSLHKNKLSGFIQDLVGVDMNTMLKDDVFAGIDESVSKYLKKRKVVERENPQWQFDGNDWVFQ